MTDTRRTATARSEDGEAVGRRPGGYASEFPALSPEFVDPPTLEKLTVERPSAHPPRILLLYGSLRERSYSRLLVEEADRLLRGFGAETRIYDPRGLPQPDDVDPEHPKVAELREASVWSEGHVWCSPERHGTITGIFKSQIDWLPLQSGGVRPTQGRQTKISGALTRVINAHLRSSVRL